MLVRFFEDLPPRAIAARLGLGVDTVKTRLERGLVALRARLDRVRRSPDLARRAAADHRKWARRRPRCLDATSLGERRETAKRASCSASKRSFLLSFSVMDRTLHGARHALATITSCPNVCSSSVIHAQCVPVSSATTAAGMLNRCVIACLFVATSPRSIDAPSASSVQSVLLRSPTSNPIVIFDLPDFVVSVMGHLPGVH